ncbi:MAG: HAD family phosphatase [Candidatus Hydrogenedentes bacterium]|nr:HAD family phosphatase [Candidatus Hydrogenedentota bacterium]
MIQAYFFDLDGTLVDTEILWVEAMESLAHEHGYALSRDQALRMVYGISWPEIYKRFKRKVSDLPWTLDEMGVLLEPHFLKLRDNRDICITTSIHLLRQLAEKHPVAVVSGSYRQDVEAAMDIMGIGTIVDFYLGHEDYHPGKPHPACYQRAAEIAKVIPEHCVVFEDSNAGICAAKDAGMYGVALSRSDRPVQDYSRADIILDDLSKFSLDML